jgi:hypothetical protein
MTGYLAFSIYSYIAFGLCWKVEKLYLGKKEYKQIKIWNVLKHLFRVIGTALLIAHLLS